MPVLLLALLTAAVPAQATTAATSPSIGWPSYGGGPDESHYSPLNEIDARNVSRLGLAWSLDLPGENSLEAVPLLVDGTLYFTGSLSTTYAVDALSGRLRWKHDPQVFRYKPDSLKLVIAINRGAAYSHGKVFAGAIDGRLFALDATSGRLLWSVDTVAAGSKNTITGAPRVCGGKVLIGNGGADYSARGYVTAYEPDTGAQAWRFFTVPTNPATETPPSRAMHIAARTWSGEWWKAGGGGGTVWDSMTCDEELHRLYLGVGNSGPYDPRVRSPGGGDNLFLASIVALDARSGEYVWHYQVNPREAWDYKATTNMISATLAIDGKAREVLMQSPSNGFFYVIDRLTGKLISAQKTGKVTWAERVDQATGRPVEARDIRYETGSVDMWPGPFGSHNWQPMAYSPRTGLVYIPYMQLGARYSSTAPVHGTSEQVAPLAGVNITPLLADDEDGTGSLLAWDPVAQLARWKTRHVSMWNGGTLATGGDLVFQGDAEGAFDAFEARTGERLWHFDAKLGIIAAPISYALNGRQYVSILVGYGGATPIWSSIMHRGWKFAAQPRRLLTFVLDGTAQLPKTAPADFSVQPLDDPSIVIDAERASAGEATYARRCMMCHGGGLLSAGLAPDLRESPAALSLATFKPIVQGGALINRGMPQFADLTEGDVQDIHLYIRAKAREALQGAARSAPDAKSRS